MIEDFEVVARLIFTALLCGCIGYEREKHGRAAGLRTHILVGVGSCLIMLTSLYIMYALAGVVTLDPTRLAAQVISGIGFLGAGTIIRFRASVRGLTTAASLWVVAGIGIAVGAGFVFGAVATTLIILLALFGLGKFEQHIRREWLRTLIIESKASSFELAKIREVLADHEVEIRDIEIKPTNDPNISVVELSLKLMSRQDEASIVGDVLRVEGVRRANWA
jgi:putative Mg2+ transporter-C (MgtC) family protein